MLVLNVIGTGETLDSHLQTWTTTLYRITAADFFSSVAMLILQNKVSCTFGCVSAVLRPELEVDLKTMCFFFPNLDLSRGCTRCFQRQEVGQ